jgi:tetratricopeptide (TPR) repeat protein
MNLTKSAYQIVFLFSILLLFFLSSAGQEKIDSLNNAIENEHSILRKSKLYLELSLAYKLSDLDKSEKVASKALTFAEQVEDQKIIGLIHAHLGDIAFLQDSLNKAQMEYNYAIPLLQQAGEFSKLIRVYLNLGNRFVEKGNYPEAMNYYLKGFSLSEQTADSTYLPNLFNNLGVVYLNINDHQKALEYYTKALPLFEKLKDTMNIAGATTNIGSIYIQLKDYDIARQYYQKGYEIFRQIDYPAGQAHALFKLGLLDIKQARYEDALKNLFDSRRFQEANPDNAPGSRSLFMAETNINIGIAYLMQENYVEAEQKLLDGYHVALEEGQVSLIALAGENLSKLYRQKGNFEEALDYYTTFKMYSDSLFNEDNIRKLTQLEMQNEFEASIREAEIGRLEKEQEKKRLLIIYITTIVGLLLILTIVALLLKLENKKKKEVELERKRLFEKLEHTNKELTTYVMYLLKKNEFILTIIEKLKKARLDAKPENKKVMAELIAELKSNTDTVSWEEFEVRFQQVHTDFYTRLSKQYPDLTNNEIRLCAFFKLNMTSKEIAALTYQSLNSIKVARYRLRKKLKMEQEESLVSFLAQF